MQKWPGFSSDFQTLIKHFKFLLDFLYELFMSLRSLSPLPFVDTCPQPKTLLNSRLDVLIKVTFAKFRPLLGNHILIKYTSVGFSFIPASSNVRWQCEFSKKKEDNSWETLIVFHLALFFQNPKTMLTVSYNVDNNTLKRFVSYIKQYF